ncbi:MAG: hypothetical protein U1E43_01325 [Rhodospirillales bacterium]
MQRDFGGFDPSFIGITTRLGSERAFNFYKFFVSSSDPPNVSNFPEEIRFKALALASVVSHEVRHFHDFLLTPYSARVFKTRIEAFINIFQVLPYLFKPEANCLPLPISLWCKLDECERETVLKNLPPRSDGKLWSPVSLPNFNLLDEDIPKSSELREHGEDAIRFLIHIGATAIKRIRQFTYNPRMVSNSVSFQPWQIFEMSGLMVQLQDIYHQYGADETQFFISCLSKQSNPYAEALNLAYSMLYRHEIVDHDMVNLAVTWSLFGSYSKDAWNACPTERFMRIWDHLRKRDRRYDLSDCMDIFNTWSRDLNLSTVEEGIMDATKTYTRLRDNLERNWKHLENSRNASLLLPLRRVLDGMVKANAHMVSLFVNSPNEYVYSKSYVNSACNFVNPIHRMMFRVVQFCSR